MAGGGRRVAALALSRSSGGDNVPSPGGGNVPGGGTAWSSRSVIRATLCDVCVDVYVCTCACSRARVRVTTYV